MNAPQDLFEKEILNLKFGKHEIKVAQLKNPEALFDELLKKDASTAEVADEQIPYWGDLWPSAIALSEFIAENENIVADKKAIEIGCGLGLPGIVAAKSGAKVTLTDYLPDALAFATYNWNLNHDSPGDLRILDWRSVHGEEKYDIVLASDVAYESRSFLPLMDALKKLVSNHGSILISEPNRAFAKTFFSGLKRDGYSVSEMKKKVLKDGQSYSISIHHLKKD